MSEKINFDVMPIFLRNDREQVKKDKAFVNTEVQENELLKQPEFLENVYKSMHMKKNSDSDNSENTTLNKNETKGSFNLSEVSTEKFQKNKAVIDDMFSKLIS